MTRERLGEIRDAMQAFAEELKEAHRRAEGNYPHERNEFESAWGYTQLAWQAADLAIRYGHQFGANAPKGAE